MANLLIVEDDIDIAEPLAGALRGEGHSVRLAFDGKQGLSLLDTETPDLILCDVEMPELTGPEMAARMFLHNAGREEVPIVLFSGVADLHKVATRVGTPYFLAKPFSLDRLFSIVDHALTERRPPRPQV